MKFINDLLYIEFSEMEECNISGSYMRKAKATGTKCWDFLDDPDDKRKVLVRYDNLKDKYKEQVQKRYGNPYEYVAKQPIRNMVETDFKAEEFFLNYRYDGDKMLPVEHVRKYTRSASWLKMLGDVEKNKKNIKQSLGLSVAEIWIQVGEIIETDKIDLPSSYSRLLLKIKEFKEKGYDCLIDWRFGNKLSAKIGKSSEGFDPELAAKQIALIRKAASMHNNFDAAQITGFVNQVFIKNAWPTVSHGTVYSVIKANEHLTTNFSRGKRVYNNEISMQVKRSRPEFPMQYFTLDGWTVELAYMGDDGKVSRLVAEIVVDAMNNYPIGYAIGNTESAELIRQACRNAVLHAQELFGALYKPWQIQHDNFAIKANTSFYQAMAHLDTPAAVGNAKTKVIEPYFMYLNKKYCQPQYNWMGFNVDAKKSNQVNREFSDKIKKSFPDKAGVIAQIETIIMKDRALKIEAYMQKWEMCPAEKIPAILKRKDWLMVFGKPTGYANSITGMGLTTTINGQQITYDSFNPQFRALQHLRWNVIYDEFDLSSILVVSEDGKNSYVLEQKRVIPMAIRDMKPEDHTYLSKIKEFKKDREKQVMQTYIEDAALVNEVLDDTLYLDSDAELALKGMFTYNGQQKEALQDAKGLKRIEDKKEKKRVENEQQQDVDNWQAMQQQYLNSKVDFNQNWD